MSKKISEKEYKKTFSYKFVSWFNGTRDFFTGELEMKPQELRKETRSAQKKRENDIAEIQKKANDISNNRGVNLFEKFYRVFAVLFCIVLVAVLVYGVAGLPAYGNPDNPVNNEVAQRYIENGVEETGAINIVTGMILDYRAFDTLGESHVLFIATCAVLILLRKDGKRSADKSDRLYEPKNDIILQTVAKILCPPIFIFGIYVILCGHLGPGGGFSGGAIIGAGLILYINAFGFAKTERFFTSKTYKVMSICALGCYALCKSYSFYTGANEIHSIIPNGTPGNIISSGLILILNICVGVVVAGTMYTFYVMFRKGDY